MKKTIAFLFSFILLLLPIELTARTTIIVNNQLSFDNIKQDIVQLINSGEKTIIIKITSGYYIAKENHLFLSGINAPKVSISILAEDAVIIPEGKSYNSGDNYIGKGDVNNSWMSNGDDLKTWSDSYYAEGLVEVIDSSRKLCRLKRRDNLHQSFLTPSHILIPHWYRSSIYKIDKFSNEYIYFTASDLKYTYDNGYIVNEDYHYGKKQIRYKLFNVIGNDDCLFVINGKVNFPKGIISAREGFVKRYIYIEKCYFQSFEISNLHFWGNSFEDGNSAIFLSDSYCSKFILHDCQFRGMRGNVITINATPNVCIENNIFKDCYYFGVKSDNKSKNIIVRDNYFQNFGYGMQNTFCIVCQGENYLISGNKMIDFGYGGIGVGLGFMRVQSNPCYGKVEDNEMTNTETYMENISNFGIMDSGAITVWTKNDGTIIRNNLIHGYSGMGDNRGIFCDDGAYNIQILDNVITGITNSYCIDSRRVPNVEILKTPGSNIERANVNIVIRGNIVDGGIRFVAHEGKNNGCIKGVNYVISEKDKPLPINVQGNVVNWQEDVVLDSNGTSNGKIHLTTISYRTLKKNKNWRALRKYVTKD